MNEVPPGQPGAHRLDRAQHHRGLPVALAAEPVAVGHQPLHGEPGQLAQAAEVLEVGGERPEPAVGRGTRAAPARSRAPYRSDSCRSPPAQLGRDAVGVVVLLDQLVDVRLGDRVDRGHQVVDAVGVDRDAEPQLGLDLVALGDRDVAHVVAEAGQPQRADGGRARGGPRPGGDPRPHRGSETWPATVLRATPSRVWM